MNCMNCNKPITIGDKRKKFCNSSCAATFNNLKRSQEGYTLSNKKKNVSCLDCNQVFEVGINSRDDIRCPDCAYQKILDDANIKTIIQCADCGTNVFGCKFRLYCDLCAKIRITQGARKSVFLQKRK